MIDPRSSSPNIAGKPTIALTCCDAEGPMPLIRTVWIRSFHDDHARDAFFDWLCEWLDRWKAWAEIAFNFSGAALTAHFLFLLAAGMSERRSAVGASMLDGGG